MKHTAQWLRQTHLFGKDEYQCSACGFLSGRPVAACPRCGANMKGAKSGASWVDALAAFDAIFED